MHHMLISTRTLARIEGAVVAPLTTGVACFRHDLVTALHTGYVTKAVLALSAYLPLRAQLSTATAKSPLIFLAHGQQDTVLPISYMEIAQQMMEVLGYKISAHRYPMDHTLCEDELLDLRTFLHTIADSQETIPCQ